MGPDTESIKPLRSTSVVNARVYSGTSTSQKSSTVSSSKNKGIDNIEVRKKTYLSTSDD